MAWNPNIPAVTNRVQDDLDAIRENFQVLDGHLADTNNPHQVTAAQVGAPTQAAFDAHVADTNNPHNVQAQQVPYSSGVAGFTPADVKAALDALAGVRIVEMGSNSNGTYVRWENGLQVCFARFGTSGVPYTTAVGPLYARDEDNNWVFPSAFTSSPWVIGLTERQFDDRRSFIALTLVSSTSVTFRPILTVREAGALLALHAHLCAIGWWK